MPISVPGHADHRFRADGDQDSGMMPITRSGADPDQLITIVGMVIAMARNVFHRAR